MAQEKMSDDYKQALERKKLDSFRKQAMELKMGQSKHKVISAKKDAAMGRGRKIALKQKEVLDWRVKFKEAEKKQKENAYGLFGTIALVDFAVLAGAAIVLMIDGQSRALVVSLLLAGLGLLIVSMIFQMLAMEAEKRVREYGIKLRKAVAELNHLKSIAKDDAEEIPPQ